MQKHLPITALRNLYLSKGIKRKFIKERKTPAVNFCQEEGFQEMRVLDELGFAREAGLTIYYMDEIVFSKRAINKREWSRSGENITIDQNDVYTGYKCAIATIGAEKGIEFLQIYDKAVDAENFKDFLHAFSKKLKGKPFALFMDQLNVHKAKIVNPVYK